MHDDSVFEQVASRRYGAHGVLFEFGSDEETMRAYQLVQSSGFAECIPGARTVYIESRDDSARDIEQKVRTLLQLRLQPETHATEPNTLRSHTIEVVYDGEDLADVAAITGLPVEQVIQRHSRALYTVAFLGFSRSFPYLRGLDPTLHVPRRSTPRTEVPAGSVGIGAGFTGIYPMSSPGGWQLLGRTAAVMFDADQDPPSLLSPGDTVMFVPIPSNVPAPANNWPKAN